MSSGSSRAQEVSRAKQVQETREMSNELEVVESMQRDRIRTG